MFKNRKYKMRNEWGGYYENIICYVWSCSEDRKFKELIRKHYNNNNVGRGLLKSIKPLSQKRNMRLNVDAQERR